MTSSPASPTHLLEATGHEGPKEGGRGSLERLCQECAARTEQDAHTHSRCSVNTGLSEGPTGPLSLSKTLGLQALESLCREKGQSARSRSRHREGRCIPGPLKRHGPSSPCTCSQGRKRRTPACLQRHTHSVFSSYSEHGRSGVSVGQAPPFPWVGWCRGGMYGPGREK